MLLLFLLNFLEPTVVYIRVHHIVSNVCGQKIKNVSPGKVISSVFPGGTITGCPKVRCMDILGELALLLQRNSVLLPREGHLLQQVLFCALL